MIIEALFIGVIVGFVFYEVTGISPGGVIVPGYIALHLHQPGKIAVTLCIALAVWGILELSSRHLIVYGRRKLLLALLLSFCLKLAIEHWIQPMQQLSFDLQSIGYIIPGLIANEIARQKFLPTIFSLGIVSILVYFILLLVPA